MPIGSAIAVVDSLKASIDIVRAVAAAGTALDKAELQLKMADVATALSDARRLLEDQKHELRDKDREIDRLREAFENRSKVIKHGGAYFELTADGKPQGDPYCMNCWEDKQLLRHLATPHHGAHPAHCPKCGTKYEGKTVMLSWLGTGPVQQG